MKRTRDDDDDIPLELEEELKDHKEYVPLKDRRKQKFEKVSVLRKAPSAVEKQRQEKEEQERRKREAVHKEGPESNKNLLEEHAKLRRQQELNPRNRIEEQLKEEEEIMRSIRAAKALASVEELAKGIKYDTSLTTGWRPPRHVRERKKKVSDAIREEYNITLETLDGPTSENVPLCTRFEDLKLNPVIMKELAKKRIVKPSPIQMQALPLILSGRDMIGVAFTGSGKTLAFTLPAIMFCFEQERKLNFQRGEGPYAVVMCPSRELARQTVEVVKGFTDALDHAGEVRLCVALAMGGVDFNSYTRGHSGVHIAIATPGRLMDLLKKGRLNLDVCRYFCLDEADRMIDLGFEDDVRTIFSYFKGQRQTILFSATMPTKIKAFAYSALVNPITVNVGRKGAANLDVIQEVEYVKQEAKVMYLLECLQKTPPPVIIFSERKGDVDDMYEYLLLKGVEAVAIHGGKDQEERDLAIRAFKEGRKDVLIATDVASKGLDFPEIKHVINYDMPEDLEDYIHRIGRTGRAGKTGIATTFINKMVSQTTLLDLKHMLIESKQRVPPFLTAYTSDMEKFLNIGGIKGCAYCGGPGHRITECPKRENIQNRETMNVGRSDFTRGGDMEM
eukprot:m.144259 g.144259  ORF g.144259 m.144259 type:complete len:618 (-) comp14913_c0_seq2:1197-3050(-)